MAVAVASGYECQEPVVRFFRGVAYFRVEGTAGAPHPGEHTMNPMSTQSLMARLLGERQVPPGLAKLLLAAGTALALAAAIGTVLGHFEARVEVPEQTLVALPPAA
jgi:hypothetical protein